MKVFLKLLLWLLLAIALWQVAIWIFNIPSYFLPAPLAVVKVLFNEWRLILHHAAVSLLEMLLGFVSATLLGMSAALSIAYCQYLRLSLLPILVLSQAIPSFAIAPLLVLWLGYGLSSKIALTTLMLFFPIMSAFLDGLSSTPLALRQMAQLMSCSQWRILWHIQVPSALPKLASGLRMAAAAAPLAAILGEWVGANQGIGYLLLEANARLASDWVFAALSLLMVLAIIWYFVIDVLLKQWITW